MSDDDKFIKKPGAKVSYSKKELDELRGCLDPVNGPMYFMENFMMIQHPTQGTIKFEPYDYQRGLVDCYHNNRYSIALISRQMGKCLQKEININVRNKSTGEILNLSIGEFHELCKQRNNN